MRSSSAAEPTIGLRISRRRRRGPYRNRLVRAFVLQPLSGSFLYPPSWSFLAKPTGGSQAGSTVSSRGCRSKVARVERIAAIARTRRRPGKGTHTCPIEFSSQSMAPHSGTLRFRTRCGCPPREIVLTVVESAAHELARQVGIAPDIPSDVAQDGRAGGTRRAGGANSTMRRMDSDSSATQGRYDVSYATENQGRRSFGWSQNWGATPS